MVRKINHPLWYPLDNAKDNEREASYFYIPATSRQPFLAVPYYCKEPWIWIRESTSKKTTTPAAGLDLYWILNVRMANRRGAIRKLLPIERKH